MLPRWKALAVVRPDRRVTSPRGASAPLTVVMHSLESAWDTPGDLR